jgi:exopolysaccharide biosynthesis polyprenyl glycosylphosphotransferase
MAFAETVTVETAVMAALPGVEGRRLRASRHSIVVAFLTDVVAVVLVATAIGTFMSGDLVASAVSITQAGASHPGMVLLAFSVIWLFLLACCRMYDRWFLENTAGMVQRVIRAAVLLAALVAPACLLVDQLGLLKPLVVAVPLVAGLTIAGRFSTVRLLRMWQREYVRQRTLVIGPADSVAGLLESLNRDRGHGLRVTGACITDLDEARKITAQWVPVYGDLSDVAGTAAAVGCSAVLVALPIEFDAYRLRRLAWELSDAGIELLVAPALADVAPERVAVLPSGGGPLLHVRAPVLTGPQRAVKNVLDRFLALVLLVLAAPLLITIAAAIRLTSPGPALFRQQRVGVGGKQFTCFKFRTMYDGADARRHEISHLNHHRDGLLFKIRRDPRVTKLGSTLRRSSLDELPQLLNVLAGTMSMVGPRPPLPSEVAAYDEDVRRRLLVRPGITGLWQVSGRSELSWTESVRLDLHYVDNWSPLLDLRILFRTAKAVVHGTGAY